MLDISLFGEEETHLTDLKLVTAPPAALETSSVFIRDVLVVGI